MTRKSDSDFAHESVTRETAPGIPAAHSVRAVPVVMHLTPGAVPDFPKDYQDAIDGNADALAALQSAALAEMPEAQYFLGSFYLLASDPDAAEAWLRKATAHQHHKAALMLAGMLLNRAEHELSLEAFTEAEPLIAQCAAAGDATAQAAMRELHQKHGITISNNEGVTQ